jgi:hypothetical protein
MSLTPHVDTKRLQRSALSTWLRLHSSVGVPANINARIGIWPRVRVLPRNMLTQPPVPRQLNAPRPRNFRPKHLLMLSSCGKSY